MATFLQFPSQLTSFSSSKYPSSFFFKNHACYRRHNILCLATTKKSRPSRKLMSDEELCNVLREFVGSVGLPEDHIPSTKDLSEHGRKDLANIVRRRGHKFIKMLLSNSSDTVIEGSETVTDESNLQKSTNDKFSKIYVHEETGQEEKVNDLIEESRGIPLMDDSSSTGNSLVINSESDVNLDDSSHVLTESQASLQEKVEKFMKYGELDTVEDEISGGLRVNFVKEGKSSSSGDDIVECEPVMNDEVDLRHSSFSNNGPLMLQSLPAPTTVDEKITRDETLSAQRQTDTGFDSDANLEGNKMENEFEIDHLKRMLHQKELELSRLKEEIEKEKNALAILQSKAENEISKAQNLISEKDAELLVAEESLSGLVEAKIQYTGEGQMVEVAGSFNGWHQRIKMEPEPFSALMDPVGTRNSQLWSTTLWLYPGVYEVKFIVDGQWKINPQLESTIKGGIENNLLRVRALLN